ncbi:MAG: tetratricopeptide repeat protein [Sedimentisphaerales bacterium]|nr:tetratricopeptide repeat protein [Sedimentisphaerales bacterium]
MKSLKDIKKIVKQFSIKPRSEMRSKVLKDALDVQRSQKHLSDMSIWRMIMHSKITKLAAAAAVIIICIGIFTILNHSAKTAYAIEQTITAMRSISSVHAYCTDWDGSRGEVWVQVNPVTGEEEYCYSDIGNLVIVGTPEVTYYYQTDENRVRIRAGYVTASDVRFSYFFEDMIALMEQYEGELTINNQYDEELRRDVIIVRAYIPDQPDMPEKEFVVRVDPQTKLPISIEVTICAAGNGVKSVDRLEYNLPIPEGIFEFEIPEGAEVVDESRYPEANECFDRGRRALAAGDFAQAKELFERVIAIQPMRNRAHYWLGVTYCNLGQYDTGIAQFTAVIDMFGEYNMDVPYARFTRGLAYAAAGNEQAANEDLLAVLPTMIGHLRDGERRGNHFDGTDDPLLRDRNEEQQIRSAELSRANMIRRLRKITGEDFGFDVYDREAYEVPEAVIEAWERWYAESPSIEIDEDYELEFVLPD